MSTAQEYQFPVSPTSSGAMDSLWSRVGAAMKAALSVPTKSVVQTELPGASRTAPPPIAGKIATISTVGTLAPLNRNAGRPGVQGRWKASHRVAMP